MSRAAYLLGKLFGYMIILYFLIILYGAARDMAAYDDTDDHSVDPPERSGMALLTDHGTGCQYLQPRGSMLSGLLIIPSPPLTPRLDQFGQQVCGHREGR